MGILFYFKKYTKLSFIEFQFVLIASTIKCTYFKRRI